MDNINEEAVAATANLGGNARHGDGVGVKEHLNSITNGATARPEGNGAATKLSAATLADLARSGLTAEDAERMGVAEVHASVLRKLLGDKAAERARKAPVYAIPYDETFCRFRFLDGEDPKYLQLIGFGSRLYFPKFGIDWAATLGSKRKLYFCEGEKSSQRAAKEGIPMIALGGCANYSGRQQGAALTAQFNTLGLNGRPIEYVADSDAATNPDVMAAMHTFAKALSQKGAGPIEYLILPPGPDGSKQSYDDFTESGLGAVYEFPKLERHKFGLLTDLYEIREQWAVITEYPVGAILNMRTGDLTKKESYLIATGTKRATTIDARTKKPKMVAAGPEYLNWPYRREYRAISYLPGQPRDLADGSFNAWPGWGCESIKGDVTPWTQFLDHLFGDDLILRRWGEQWIAYPIQYPGAKLQNSLVLRGDQGSGKTTLGVALRRIYGNPNSYVIGNSALSGRFNAPFANKQLIIGAEITSKDKRHDSEQMKTLTDETISIERKGVDPFELPNVANFLYLSNSVVPISIESGDRRYGVAVTKTKLAPEITERLRKWIENGGAEAIRYHLEHLDLTGFNPYGPAPENDAKRETMKGSQGLYDSWASKIMEDDERPTICTFEDLKHNATQEISGFPNPAYMRDALTRAGAKDSNKSIRINPGDRNLKRAVWFLREIPRGIEWTDSTLRDALLWDVKFREQTFQVCLHSDSFLDDFLAKRRENPGERIKREIIEQLDRMAVANMEECPRDGTPAEKAVLQAKRDAIFAAREAFRDRPWTWAGDEGGNHAPADAANPSPNPEAKSHE
jgi:hypothetical protein